MPYGTIKVDTITFTDGGVDKSVAISGLVQNPTFTGNVTVTGTVSGATIRATTVSGVTISGTTVNAASGVFTTQISGAVVVAPAGTVSAPSVQVGTGASIAPGFYGAGTDQLGVSTGGSSRLIIDSVGQIRVVTLGSAAAPALVVGNDINTGIYSPGADQIGISTNGAGRLFVDASGGIGIGTTSPNATLHVAGPARIGANDTSDAELQIGAGATGNRNAYIDLVGDTTYTDYGLRLLRNNNGANGDSFLTHRGTGTLYLKCEDGGSIGFGTNNTERLRITSAGLVGIGTSSPGAALDVQGNIRLSASNPNIEFNNGGAMIYGPSANTLAFATGGGVSSPVEKARIDSSGRLLVGTSTYVQGNTYTTGNLLNVSGGSGVGPQLSTYSADAFALGIDFSKSRSASVGTGTIVQSGDALGNILFNGHDGTGYKQAAAITAVVDGTPGSNDMPGRLVFSTTADGFSSPAERMRITGGGTIRIGQSTTDTPGFGNTTTGIGMEPNNGALFLSRPDGGCSLFINSNLSTGTADAMNFRRSDVFVGSITTTTTSTAYNTSSDYRLKENVTAVTDGIARLQQLKPSRFNFIADPTKTVDGFLAHEVQSVVPEAITGEKDAVNDDGNPVYQGIDQSKLVPLVVAALQEALERINLLEAKVASLEAK